MFRFHGRKLVQIYIWALSFLSKYKWEFFLVILFMLISTFIQLIIPRFVQYFIDELILEKRQDQFFMWIGVIAGLLILSIFLKTIQNILRIRFQENASRDLQFTIFQHTRKLGFPYFESHPVGETLSLLNSEVSAMQKLYKEHLPTMLEWTIYALIAGIMMFQINFKLALSTLPCLLLYYIIGPSFVKKSALYGKRLSDQRIQFNQKVNETMSSLPELKINSAENWGLSRLTEYQSNMGKSFIKVVFYAYAKFAVRNFSFYIGFVILLLYGYWLIQRDELTIGGISAFLIYYIDTMKRITGVIASISEQKVLMHQVEKLYDFCQMEPDDDSRPNAIKCQNIRGNLEFQNVTFRYPHHSSVLLNNLSFTVESGEKVAIVGASGSGKSTILKILGRFYTPSDGVVLLDGVPLQHYEIHELRDLMGFVFQETYLFGRTVRENILFGNPDASEEEVIQAAKSANAHDFIMALPNGYDTFVGERGVKLSGGQRQRISIARMFLRNPKIIILDEATSALDNLSELEVMNALEKLCRGRTTIMVTHRLSSIVHMDRILVLHHGRIAEWGSHTELLNKKGIYYRMHQTLEVQNG